MKSKASNSTNLNWSSPIKSLFKGETKTCSSLNQAGFQNLEDLLWILPIKIFKIPKLNSFNYASVGSYFRGQGEVISFISKPNFKSRGKGRAMLHNVSMQVLDPQTKQALTLKWFNCYSSQNEKLSKLKHIQFVGVVSEYLGGKQIVSPDFQEVGQGFQDLSIESLKIQYPTINGVNTSNIKKTIDKIPNDLWNQIEDPLPENILTSRDLIGLKQAFKTIHGKITPETWSDEAMIKSKNRLIYEEFFDEQIRIHLRRSKSVEVESINLTFNENEIKSSLDIFPYTLTADQRSTIEDILEDLKSNRPMMRLVQGDVGCGKTSVALISSFLTYMKGHQTAFMCPTESLALQHYQESIEFLSEHGVKVELLIGSHSEAKKKEIKRKLNDHEIDLIIGTHALIQDDVIFKKLALVIIDEQHKFGVDQRLKLSSKQIGCHTLIMTATPIPRSLSLTQYGDLDISIIKTMPSGRKGHKTRIVNPENFQNFLTFVNTRLQMKEQIYIVVPAITESETQDILNLEKVLEKFKTFFPETRISGLHGQLKSDEKTEVFNKFKKHEIDMLIATSVIEVGINVLNATVIAIMNPERFGLSSLHQLRGRVGRGSKPGFCFLVNDKRVSAESLQRLRVIEDHVDGFKIAEEDLKIRGSGDLFGKNQSGISEKRIANIIEHQSALIAASEDLKEILKSPKVNQKLTKRINQISQDKRIFSTT